MNKAIYYKLITLTFVAIIICSLIAATDYAVYTQNQTKEWLTKLTLSVTENYKYITDVEALSQLAGGNRISIIAPDGTVLADSEADAVNMENHVEREEVEYAKPNQVYIAIRTSHTLGQQFMYASLQADNGNIVRLAHSYAGILHNLVIQLPAVLTAILVALILSLFLARKFAKAVTNPLEKVIAALSAQEYAKLRHYKSPYYEIDKMMASIQALLEQMTDSQEKLHDEQEKVNYILSNMAEGFILVDGKKNILLCNNSARDFFAGDSHLPLDNIYQLTHQKTIINAIDLALEKKQSAMFDLKLKDDLIVNLYISPWVMAESAWGATILLVDMTAEKQLEQQKRDFFSNASHELKTPITSILGFSEMINKDIVRSEAEKTAVMERIDTEARRLSELINDILTVAKLESNSAETETTAFSFGAVITEAVNSVSPIKDKTTIDIDLKVEDLLYQGDRRQIYELCVNLIENAIKYNKPEGKVFISLKTENNNAVLTVKDTGIGIPPEYQSRVFERFFRVDYGRDKKVGGTGLGLSIVKHIVHLYGGKIALQSEPNAGTTVEITLPL